MLPERCVSTVVGTVAVVAVVVVLAVGVLAAGMTVGVLGDPPPSATVETAEVVAGCQGCGPADQVIQLHHRGGNPIPVTDLAIVLAVPEEGVQARVTDLPLERNCLTDGHVAGDDIVDGRCARVAGPVTAVGDDADGRWSAGETVLLRIQKAAVRLDADEAVDVRLVHTPSGTTVAAATAPVVRR